MPLKFATYNISVTNTAQRVLAHGITIPPSNAIARPHRWYVGNRLVTTLGTIYPVSVVTVNTTNIVLRLRTPGDTTRTQQRVDVFAERDHSIVL